jgi:hypothetical protein
MKLLVLLFEILKYGSSATPLLTHRTFGPRAKFAYFLHVDQMYNVDPCVKRSVAGSPISLKTKDYFRLIIMNFFYLLTLLFNLNSALALRCYTGVAYGYSTPLNSSSLIDCQNYGIMGYSCMKMIEYATATTVRFCNNYNCSVRLYKTVGKNIFTPPTSTKMMCVKFLYHSSVPLSRQGGGIF